MSSENELKEGNIQQPEENEGSGEIEGYSYCNSHKARCLNDWTNVRGKIWAAWRRCEKKP